MSKDKDLEVGSAMLMARIIDIEKARGTRIQGFHVLKPSTSDQGKRRTAYFIFSGFKRRWIRMTDPGPEAA